MTLGDDVIEMEGMLRYDGRGRYDGGNAAEDANNNSWCYQRGPSPFTPHYPRNLPINPHPGYLPANCRPNQLPHFAAFRNPVFIPQRYVSPSQSHPGARLPMWNVYYPGGPMTMQHPSGSSAPSFHSNMGRPFPRRPLRQDVAVVLSALPTTNYVDTTSALMPTAFTQQTICQTSQRNVEVTDEQVANREASDESSGCPPPVTKMLSEEVEEELTMGSESSSSRCGSTESAEMERRVPIILQQLKKVEEMCTESPSKVPPPDETKPDKPTQVFYPGSSFAALQPTLEAARVKKKRRYRKVYMSLLGDSFQCYHCPYVFSQTYSRPSWSSCRYAWTRHMLRYHCDVSSCHNCGQVFSSGGEKKDDLCDLFDHERSACPEAAAPAAQTRSLVDEDLFPAVLDPDMPVQQAQPVTLPGVLPECHQRPTLIKEEPFSEEAPGVSSPTTETWLNTTEAPAILIQRDQHRLDEPCREDDEFVVEDACMETDNHFTDVATDSEATDDANSEALQITSCEDVAGVSEPKLEFRRISKCPFCTETFPGETQYQLKRLSFHVQKYHAYEDFQCSTCSKDFLSYLELLSHQETCRKRKCDVVSSSPTAREKRKNAPCWEFPSSTDLSIDVLESLIEYAGRFWTDCNRRDQQAPPAELLQSNWDECSDSELEDPPAEGDELETAKCGRCFETVVASEMRFHLQSVHGVYQCLVCDHEEPERLLSVLHMRRCHQDTYPPEDSIEDDIDRCCRLCGFLVHNPMTMWEHVASDHGSGHVCEFCYRTFNHRRTLRDHIEKSHDYFAVSKRVV